MSDAEQQTTATWDTTKLQQVQATHPGLVPPKPEPQPVKDFALLIELHESGQLTAGRGGQIVKEAAARKALRERCARIGALHMKLAAAFYERSTATTEEAATVADEKIGNLQARMKSAEA